jgi:uncharacterized protein (TIGR03067 family)
MRMKTAIFLTAALVLGADAPRERLEDKDQKALQGKWRAESYTRDGEKVDIAKEWTDLVFENDNISWENSILKGNLGMTGVVPYSYELDSSKEPKTIDLTWSEGAIKGKKQLGIYRLEGDKLTICVARIDKERPKKFESEKGSGNLLLTLKLMKE